MPRRSATDVLGEIFALSICEVVSPPVEFGSPEFPVLFGFEL
jgi:hypothetical protein